MCRCGQVGVEQALGAGAQSGDCVASRLSSRHSQAQGDVATIEPQANTRPELIPLATCGAMSATSPDPATLHDLKAMLDEMRTERDAFGVSRRNASPVQATGARQEVVEVATLKRAASGATTLSSFGVCEFDLLVRQRECFRYSGGFPPAACNRSQLGIIERAIFERAVVEP